jgi:6-pyruvoyl-tetrahydropterin synthase
VALPISNSTAENIAKWFFDKISKDINRSNIENISIEVEEMPGQSGVYSSLIN